MKISNLKKAVCRILSVLITSTIIVCTTGMYTPISIHATTTPPAFGVISDIHLNGSSNLQQEETNLINALTKFKESGIQVLMVAGDIADAGETGAYQKFNTIFNSVFDDPASVPQKVLVMGNHDYWNGLSASAAQNNFSNTLGCSLNTHITVNGYHFIGVSTEAGDTNGVFGSSSKSWLSAQLSAAASANPSNPIFVTFHQPITDTVYLSDEWGNSTLNSVLKKYPQAIVFTGHSHAVLEDERSIHQNYYTAVNTSTLSYTELESGKANGSVPPRANEVAQGIIGSISSSAVNLQRYDFHSDCIIKNNWIINLPCSRSTFTYTDARSYSRVAPTFSAGNQILSTNITDQSCSLTFDQAVHSDFVHSYRIQVYNQNSGSIDQDFFIFSDFYLGLQRMEPQFTYELFGLSPNTSYEIRLYAIESFGKQSTAITSVFSTLATMPAADIFHVDFATGTAQDTSIYNTPYTLINNAQVQFDNTINKNVLSLNGSSYVNYAITNAQLNTISSQFTLETVFKMNTIQNQAILENCQNGGIGFESTSSGIVELWAYINGSYQRLGVQLQSGIYYHLAATYDGTALYLYLNGQLVNSIQNISGNVSHIPGIALCLGGDPDAAGTASLNLNGNIALVRIMNKAISGSDIQNHYTSFFS